MNLFDLEFLGTVTYRTSPHGVDSQIITHAEFRHNGIGHRSDPAIPQTFELCLYNQSTFFAQMYIHLENFYDEPDIVPGSYHFEATDKRRAPLKSVQHHWMQFERHDDLSAFLGAMTDFLAELETDASIFQGMFDVYDLEEINVDGEGVYMVRPYIPVSKTTYEILMRSLTPTERIEMERRLLTEKSMQIGKQKTKKL